MYYKFNPKYGCFLNKWLFFFYTLVIFVAISNCANKEKVPQHEKVLAEVNDFEINVFDFENAYITHLIQTGRNDTEEWRYYFLNEMIDRVLLAHEASKKEYLKNEFYRSALNFQQRKSMADIYFVDEMEEVLEAPTDEELRLAFAKSKRTVYVRHLFSRDKSRLAKPYRRLINGENFVDVANDFYETTIYDSSAGYLGPISYFGVDDDFAEAAFSTNQGKFTKPVRTRFGYHIIYVEHIEFPGMLAEDEYQYRKKGIQSQVRLRNQSIKSHEYVRNLMESLLVEVNPDNVMDLKKAIEGLSDDQITNLQRNKESPADFWEDELKDRLEASFDNDKVLATYVFGGERIEFSFGDYLKWLPYLSFSESKVRTGASVGRGLRNEVFYKLAEKHEYFDDERVKKQVQKRGFEILSDLYRHKLIREALEDTSAVNIPADFRERFVNNSDSRIIASYWKISAGSVEEVKAIEQDILDNKTKPESYDTFVLIEDKRILPHENDYTIVKNGLLETPIVAHAGEDGWIVLKVISKNITEIDEDNRQEDLELEQRYKVFKNLNSTIQELREESEIKVDTVLFNEIYNIYKNKQEAS